MYIEKNGEVSVILNDILYNPSNLGGIPSTFNYDSNGNLVNINPPEAYSYFQ